uniref:Nuclease-associated modular DNA-binding 1 domain-containing protein n=1 Tax=Morchella importuna TaxID=1174673 RepID=A0A650AG36_9PEZI|nr:hypothetical protein [Morchella importuna]QGN66718.1 hypothetical protein [Morchella importuna]
MLSSIKVKVIDKETNTTVNYDSITAAATALNIRIQAICNYLKRNQVNPPRLPFLWIFFLLWGRWAPPYERGEGAGRSPSHKLKIKGPLPSPLIHFPAKRRARVARAMHPPSSGRGGGRWEMNVEEAYKGRYVFEKI